MLMMLLDAGIGAAFGAVVVGITLFFVVAVPAGVEAFLSLCLPLLSLLALFSVGAGAATVVIIAVADSCSCWRCFCGCC